MKIKKSFLITLLVLQTVLFVKPLINPQVAFAADNQSFTDKIGSFFNDVKNKVTQTYLKVVPGEKNGKLVLKQAVQASADIETAHLDFSLKSDLIRQGKEMGNFKIGFAGPAEMDSNLDSKNAKQDLNFNGELGLEGTSYEFDVDFKMDGQTVYLKINQMPAIAFLDMTQLKDQWLRFENRERKAEKESDLTKEQERQITKAAEELIKEAKVSSAEKTEIREQGVFKVTVSFEKEEIIDFLMKVNQIVNNQEDEQVEPLKRADVEEVFNYLKVPEITLGINRSNFYFNYISLSSELDLDQALSEQPAAVALGQQQPDGMGVVLSADTMNFALEMYLSDFNQEIDFQIPSGFEDGQKKIQEALNLGGSMPGAPSVPSMPEKQMPQAPTIPEGYELSPEEVERIRLLEQRYQQ